MSAPTVWTGAGEVPVVAQEYWDGTQFRELTSAVLPRGKNRISQLGSAPGFAIAHRMGTDNYVEYTPRGATECVARGVMALELSLSRTQEGVLFGMHDRTTARTSGIEKDPFVESWEYLRTLPNNSVGNSPDPAFVGPDRYYEIHELLEPYVDSHIIFLDLKYMAGTDPWRQEVLAVLDEMFDEPREQVILKFADARASWYADWIASVGYTSWGHIWTNDYLADPVAMNEHMQHWSWLGVNADATAQMWLDAQALNKPLIGAIVNDASELATVLGEGCIGYMCADPMLLLGPSLV